MKIRLFGSQIEPACQYCEYSFRHGAHKAFSCRIRGAVTPFSHCRKFKYAPLKRIPRHSAPLPQYSKEEFEL